MSPIPFVAARAHMSVVQSLLHGDVVPINYDIIDFGGSVITPGADWHVRIPAAGAYALSGGLGLEADAWKIHENAALFIYVNGSLRSRLAFYQLDADRSDAWFINGYDVQQFAVGDLLSLRGQIGTVTVGLSRITNINQSVFTITKQ